MDVAGNIAKLEAIVEAAASGDIGLDGAVDCYEKGTTLLKECCRAIEETGRRVVVLMKSADGKSLVERPFDENETRGVKTG